MPSDPDVVAQFVVGSVCPPDSALDLLRELFVSSVLSGTEGLSVRGVAVCANRLSAGANVTTIGLWLTPENSSEEELTELLSRTNLTNASRTAGLRFGARFIQALAASRWAQMPKKQGRLTFKDLIDVELRSNEIVTKVRGKVDFPVGDVKFTLTLGDRLLSGLSNVHSAAC